MTLNAKQQAFVNEYLIDANATQAAIRAGYSQKTAYSIGQRLLKHVEVAAELARRQANIAKKANVDAAYVTTRLVEVVERCMQTAPVVTDGEPVMVETPGGKVAATFRFMPAGATRALDLLGRITGAYKADNRQRAASAKMEDVIKALDERDRRRRDELRQAQEDGAVNVAELPHRSRN